jgi:hypothetical protein
VSADRDRDASGRARNARPRDALGRPLPYGAADVARAVEGIVRTPRESLDEAQRLLDAGRPFHAHEVLEDAWKSAPGPDRGLWKALAQLAVAMTHEARGNPAGAASLRARAAAGLRSCNPGAPQDGDDCTIADLVDLVDVAGLIRWAEQGGTAVPSLLNHRGWGVE